MRFAASPVTEIFDAELLGRATKLEATELRSGTFLQQADGTFTFTPLPVAAQFAPIHGILHTDLDGDGHADLFVAGNNFGPEPSTGRFDGSISRLFRGDGTGRWTEVSPADSGLIVPGDTRAVTTLPALTADGFPRIITATARGPLRLFERR